MTLVLMLLLLLDQAAPAQDIPPGVRYKVASAEINAAARALLEAAVAKPGQYSDSKLPKTIMCGPMLWKDLRPKAAPLLLSAKQVHISLSIPQAVQTEGRGFVTPDERQEFWKTLWETHGDLQAAKVRKPTSDEIKYFWATIPFDIQEPLFVLESRGKHFIVNLPDEGQGAAMMWIDRIDNLQILDDGTGRR